MEPDAVARLVGTSATVTADAASDMNRARTRLVAPHARAAALRDIPARNTPTTRSALRRTPPMSRPARVAIAAATLYAAAAPALAGARDTASYRADLQAALEDFNTALQLQAETPDRARQLFQASAQSFAAVAASGVVNGRLEFNLANAYLKADDIGRAILHYRRAHRLMPRDPRLAENLKVARSRCLTPIRPTQRSTLIRAVFFWHYDTSTRERTAAALFAYLALWLMLTLRGASTGAGGTRRTMLILAVLAAVSAGAAGASVGVDAWSDRHATPGVITAMDVVVYKGYGTGYEKQFEQPLQPGVEFVRRERYGDWWRIELPDGQSGWVEASNARLVPTGPT